MRQLHLAELRSAVNAWASVFLAFVLIQMCVVVSGLMYSSGKAHQFSGENYTEWSTTSYLSTTLAIVCALLVVGAMTELVVTSRRGSLARLSLNGAAPGQISATVMSQLAAVTIAAAVIGDLLALAVFGWFLRMHNLERTPSENVLPVYDLGMMLFVNLACIGVALLGGWRQVRRAAKVAPVEALRSASAGIEKRMGWWRWVAAFLILLLIPGIIAVFVVMYQASLEHPGRVDSKQMANNVFQAGTFSALLVMWALATAATALVKFVTQAWTALIPAMDPAWRLARSTVILRSARMSRTAIPVFVALSLIFIGAGLTTMIRSQGITMQKDGIETFIITLGAPFLIAIAGGISSLTMMSRQRDAELALSGLVGTTLAQRIRIPIYEGLMLTVTAVLLGLLPMIAMLGVMVGLFNYMGGNLALIIPWLAIGQGSLVAALIIIGTTTLPLLAALRVPEHRVIARLIAD